MSDESFKEAAPQRSSEARLDPGQPTVALPHSLRGQFAALERRLWRLETSAAAAGIILALSASYLALFGSDRLWDSPSWLRLTLALLGWAGAALALGVWARLWVFSRRDWRDLSQLVQRKYRRLGDRLLGIVELSEEKSRPSNFSPALYRAAIHQVAHEAEGLPFQEAVDSRTAQRSFATAAILASLTIACAALFPDAARNAARRWAAPLASIPRVTLVQLSQIPAEKIVPHGEAFQLSGAVAFTSFWRPAHVYARIGDQPEIYAPIRNGRFTLPIPGQVELALLRFRSGDARHQLELKPVYRPSLKELTATLEFPAYLQYPAERRLLQSGTLSVVEGTRAVFLGTASRELSSAHLLFDSTRQELQVRSNRFTSLPLPLDTVFHCSFVWLDHLGLTNTTPWQLAVESRPDAPPLPLFHDFAPGIAMLETEVLPLKLTADDDFGVQELGFVWAQSSTNSVPGQTVTAPSPQQKRLENTFYFSPILLRIPPDSTVELRGYATDFQPGRPPVFTPPVRLHVVGNTQHAELVRQRLEALAMRLEEVTRLEEKINSQTADTSSLKQEKLSSPKAGEQIGEIQQDQAQNAAELKTMAEEGVQTLREALRNPTFTEDLLTDWAKILQQMQEVSKGPMSKASQSLSQAQQSPPSRPQELADAMEEERKALDALSEMQRSVNEGLDQLQALTLAQRLRHIGESQAELEQRLQKLVSETIGLLPKELPPHHQQINKSASADEAESQKESADLQSEISRYFERTQQPKYGQVSKEMADAKTAGELDKLRQLIEDNVTMLAMDSLQSWGKRFQAWADLLEPKPESNEGGGGSGEGGSQQPDLLKPLMALLRLRERELNLREQTRLLDQNKATAPEYTASATQLAGKQEALRTDVSDLGRAAPIEELQPPLQESDAAMSSAATLLAKPQTDQTTVTDQTKAIASLSDAINLLNEKSRKNNSSSQSSGSQDMAFLMQMMAQQQSAQFGMAMGPSAGGSLAGGATDQTSDPSSADATGASPETKGTLKTSGSARAIPTEFRDALQNYFRALEEKK